MAVVAAAAVAVAAAEAIAAAAVAVVDDSYSTIVAAAVAVADDGLHCRLRTMLLLRICASSFEYPQCRISAFASRSCLPTRVAP